MGEAGTEARAAILRRRSGPAGTIREDNFRNPVSKVPILIAFWVPFCVIVIDFRLFSAIS